MEIVKKKSPLYIIMHPTRLKLLMNFQKRVNGENVLSLVQGPRKSAPMLLTVERTAMSKRLEFPLRAQDMSMAKE